MKRARLSTSGNSAACLGVFILLITSVYLKQLNVHLFTLFTSNRKRKVSDVAVCAIFLQLCSKLTVPVKVKLPANCERIYRSDG